MSDLKIFLDMDGVLADFATGLKETLVKSGHDEEKILRQWSAWNWGHLCPIPDEDFWSPVNKGGERFWYDLPLYDWVDDLISLVHGTVGDDWHVLSAPSRCPSSYVGKIRWLRDVFGDGFDRFHLTPHKALFARIPGAVLIDDRDKNVLDFKKAGGRAILFPQEWNSAVMYVDDPVEYVRKALTSV